MSKSFEVRQSVGEDVVFIQQGGWLFGAAL